MEKIDRIPKSTAALMVIMALFFDFLQMFLNFIFIGLILNPVLVTPMSALTFFIWYKMRGVGLSDSPKRFVAYVASFLLELIPILNSLPGLTLSTLVMIIIVRAEDKEKNAKNKAKFAIQNKILGKKIAERNRLIAQREARAIMEASVEKEMENREQKSYYGEAANDNQPTREKLVA